MQGLRTTIQGLFLIGLHSSWGPHAKWFCHPVLSCHSCALAYFACPVGVFVHFAGHRVFPLVALGTVLLVGVLAGRLLCGWVCPFGFLQDLLFRIKTRKFKLPAWTANIKYGVLVLLVFTFPFLLGEETSLSFCRICPAAAAQVSLPAATASVFGGQGLAGIGAWSWVKLGVLVAVIAVVIFSSRAFCKVLCPIGALLAPLNHISLWRVKPATENCIKCRRCDRKCPTAVAPSARILQREAPSRSADCVVCHKCQAVCPQRAKERAAAEG